MGIIAMENRSAFFFLILFGVLIDFLPELEDYFDIPISFLSFTA
jgi:hypothetical protein